MASVTDKILCFAVFGAAAFLIAVRFMPWDLALAVAGVSAVALAVFFKIAGLRRQRSVSVPEMCELLALMGMKKQTELFFSTLPPEKREECIPPYIITEIKGRRTAVACLYRFLDLTKEDIASAYRFVTEKGVSSCVILTRRRSRSVLQLTALIPAEFVFPDRRRVYNYLKTRCALPTRPEIKKKRRFSGMKAEEILDYVLDPQKIKYYLLISFCFLPGALITRGYLWMILLPLTLALGTLVREKVNGTR